MFGKIENREGNFKKKFSEENRKVRQKNLEGISVEYCASKDQTFKHNKYLYLEYNWHFSEDVHHDDDDDEDDVVVVVVDVDEDREIDDDGDKVAEEMNKCIEFVWRWEILDYVTSPNVTLFKYNEFDWNIAISWISLFSLSTFPFVLSQNHYCTDVGSLHVFVWICVCVFKWLGVLRLT